MNDLRQYYLAWNYRLYNIHFGVLCYTFSVAFFSSSGQNGPYPLVRNQSKNVTYYVGEHRFNVEC